MNLILVVIILLIIGAAIVWGVLRFLFAGNSEKGNPKV